MRLALNGSMSFQRSGFPLLTLSVILAACGPKAAIQDARPLHVNPHELKVTGKISERLAKVIADDYAEPCDLVDKDRKQALIAALERAMSLPDPAPSGPTETPKDLIPFQGSFLREVPKTPPQKSGWETSYYGWSDALDLFEKKGESMTRDDWMRVNAIVMSTLMEDESRVINGENMGFDHLTIQYLPKIHDSLSTCLQDEKCVNPEFTPEVGLAVRGIPIYSYYLQALESASSSENARKLITRFEKRVSVDQKDHQFKMNSLLQKKIVGSETLITLPLDPGSLGEEEQNLAQKIIESVWAKAGTKVLVSWGSRGKTPDLFQILFDLTGTGKRPFVGYSDKTLNLFPYSRTRSIAHEFGHVLGYDDHYYTVWNPKGCAYVQESNQEDIMSDSESGEVTLQEWTELLDSANPAS
jgi:hypothetical protein